MKLPSKILLSIAGILFLTAIVLVTVIYFNKPGKIIPEAPDALPFSAKPSPKKSSVSVPIRIPLKALEDYANARLPDILYTGRNEEVDEDTRANLNIIKRDKIRLSTKDNTLDAAIPIRFEAEFFKPRNSARPAHKKSKSAQKPDPSEQDFIKSKSTEGEFTVLFKLKLDITEDWQYQSEVTADFKWDKKPYINLGPFKIRISTIVGKSIQKQLRKITDDINSSLNQSLNIKEKINQGWADLHAPAAINDNPPIWLLAAIESIHIADINMPPGYIHFDFALRTALKTVIGKKPTTLKVAPIPVLSKTLPEERGFTINLPVALEFATLTETVLEKSKNKIIELDNGTTAQIKDLNIYGNGGNIVIAVDLDADLPKRFYNVQSRIYLSGRPVLEKQVLYFRDFHFDVKTNDLLVSAASWLADNTYVIEEIERDLVFPLAEKISANKIIINQQLNKPLNDYAQTRGSIKHLYLEDLYITKNAIQINVYMQGDVAVDIAFNTLD